jgi:opacity protein-like surface antigen
MINRILALLCIGFLFFGRASAQDVRAQYPGLLRKAYFGVNLGYIDYPFGNQHMAPGYTASSVQVPHLAIRITLLGYKFNEYLSGQITYMRPFNWVEYHNINNNQAKNSVWMNVGGLTLKAQTPVRNKFSAYGEAGLGVVTRNGFDIAGVPVVKDVSFATVLAGGGVQYHLNKKWKFNVSAAYAPERKKALQPHILFLSGGFTYDMQPLSAERVQRNSSGKYIFPKNLFQVGYTTNALGYGVNKFVSEGAIPIFWGGEARLRRGFSINYQHNVFHTRKVFSLDIGTSFGYWESNINRDQIFTLSVYPMLRFTVLRTAPADFYLNYSVAGPSFISRIEVDDKNTGKNFTFRDFMGLGVYAGKYRRMNAEINIGHFSNGNVFPSNAGVMIPLGFHVGYTF